ncbi:hypothetical protein ASPACDRAFT_42437 [Aspergillus aculeatus ATCC 16872]|uniref:Uncharacterized protein n=1 Tax=Aspergillus aculeatus (strain ATCC 16872 / CBS 172.66 / WB 5094) TaxID=690307 RepID=A0A1L9WXK1_ASPA1|nr:uncharacterized protein ASPACDRAFT_42437 [Aspergillus aculeatus ATCC 16872]OJK00937.1 hypothetical protein ASPACDRAFT_42437 [Aspergillus aculeatus ATCC 16872]
MRIPWSLLTAATLLTPSALGTRTGPSSKSKNSTQYSVQELWTLEKTFWDNFLYPANLAQTKAINSTLFAPDIQGRVDITRVFNGSTLNTEYLFGLFSDPTHLSLVGVPVSYSITQFTAAPNTNLASATTVVTFNATSFGNLLLPVTIDTWIMWNAAGQIEQYDATFRWFGFLVDTLVGALAQQINGTATEATAYLTQLLANQICETHDSYCTGANQQYADKATCYAFLTQSIPLGKDYELGRNTLLCREVHEHMVQYDPTVHCPHIGPTGGEYCVNDQTYSQKVLQKYFRKSWLIPEVGGEGQDVWL